MLSNWINNDAMRKIYMLFAVVALMTTACQKDTPLYSGFESDIETIEAKATGGKYSITIRSNEEWSASTNEPWLMISPANGRGEVKCEIKVDSTLINHTREAVISFKAAGNKMHDVVVSQLGFAPQIEALDNMTVVASSARRDDRWFEADVRANVDFDVVADYDGDEEWLTVEQHTLNLDRGARPRTTTLRVGWKLNIENEERVATLKLKAREGDAEGVITVRQKAAPKIEDNRQGDSLAIVTIFELMECWSDMGIGTATSMNEWNGVRLWDAKSPSLPSEEAVGRVRDLDMSYFFTEEGIPQHIKHLKYLETLSFYGNVNTMLKSIDLCEEVANLEYLKALRIAAFGLVSLPKNFSNLGDTLEELDLNSNNFTRIPEVLTAENFPHLVSLNLASNRRQSVTDLRNGTSNIGLCCDMDSDPGVERLFLWENLRDLGLSFNYIEGQLPRFKVGEGGVRAYTYDDVKEYGDTLNWAVESGLPRILPNIESLRINLNFMSGDLPDWLLYHPQLMKWGAEVLVFEQQEKSTDSRGRKVGFDNVPTSMEYYFEKYPLYRGRYEYNDEM